MFHHHAKKRARNRFECAKKMYNEKSNKLMQSLERLHNEKTASLKTIKEVEMYLQEEKGISEKFGSELKLIRLHVSDFEAEIKALEEQLKKSNKNPQDIALKGGLAGAGVATLAPVGAMAVATSFGTASTGVAISSLSGAAAHNAALAWLGGGAVSAGGGGMAAGASLLSAAVPLGLAIGVGALVIGMHKKSKANKKYIKAANENSEKLEAAIESLELLMDKTNVVYTKINSLRTMIEADMKTLDTEKLVVFTRDLAALLNIKIDVEKLEQTKSIGA